MYMEWTRYKRHRNRQSTDTKGVTDSNSNSNSKTRCLIKIVSFLINKIIGYSYSLQLITKIIKLIKNLMKKFLMSKKTRVKVTVIPISNI